ncbi:hypothetical protein DE165_22935, partial [Salmonella enterica subsp. enterica serovar Ruiru]|nr:hypothetical protein [Salmonella enterica subsp. enterica serovar Ruiru]
LLSVFLKNCLHRGDKNSKKRMPNGIFFYFFHHAFLMLIALIIKFFLKFFHSEITTSYLVFLLRHSLAIGKSDQRVV